MKSQSNPPVHAIYSRKSKFTGKGESIGNQIEMCREYLRIHFGDQAADTALVFEDEGFSGGNLKRPAFKRMMEVAKSHKICSIVVYRLDRISRNIGDFSMLVEQLGELDIDFISIREQFDTSSPTGRAMMYISSVFSQLERETIAERIRDNMQELAKTGRWLGGITPTGFQSESADKITLDGKTRKVFHLAVIFEEAELVKSIFHQFLETRSLTKTEALLLQQNAVTKTGTSFTRFAIKNILQNPVYAIADATILQYLRDNEAEIFCAESAFDGQHGLMVYNRTEQIKGKTTKYLPMTEWIIAVGLHPGLIPGKEWMEAQKLLGENKSKAFRRSRINQALLTGLLYCRCSNRMYPKVSLRDTADSKKAFSYMCKLKEHSKKTLCDLPNLNGILLDAAVIEQIKHLEENHTEFLEQLEKSKDFYIGDRADYTDARNKARAELAANEQKISDLIDTMIGASDTIKQRITQRIEELTQLSASLKTRIKKLESLNERVEMRAVEFEVFKNQLSSFSSCIDNMTVEEQRNALRTLVRKIVWDGVKVHVVLFGAEEDALSSLPFDLSSAGGVLGGDINPPSEMGEVSDCAIIVPKPAPMFDLGEDRK